MAGKCVIGICLTILCAVPALGEGEVADTVRMSKFIEQSPAPPKRQEPLDQVKVSERYDYYPVDGTTTDELRAQMKRNGTTWNDGKVYAALTTWDIRYHYDITSSKGSYHLCSIGTDVDIVIHLPKLIPSAKTTEQLTSTWNTYLGNLKTHELGHRDIAVQIGREISRELSDLGDSSSKSELDTEAKKIVRAKFQHLKQAQIDYDQETHHGVKQGAILTEPMVAASIPAT